MNTEEQIRQANIDHWTAVSNLAAVNVRHSLKRPAWVNLSDGRRHTPLDHPYLHRVVDDQARDMT